ncbi:hypothetical protein BGY98DRAFT_959893, partial [Russula aff. rugulosa BPL654]
MLIRHSSVQVSVLFTMALFEIRSYGRCDIVHILYTYHSLYKYILGASSLRSVLDLEVARLALFRNFRFDGNTTRPLRLKTSPYLFGWPEGTNTRRWKFGLMPMASAMTL